MALTTNRIKPVCPPARLTDGLEVLYRDVLDDVEPPVELRLIRNAMPILERDPARRFSYLVQFIREGDPAETQGFDDEAAAYAFIESVLEWNQDEGDARHWPAWTDEARYEPNDLPSDPSPEDVSWWMAQTRLTA